MSSITIDPQLSIATVAGGEVQITWPTNDAAYVLEQASALPAAWSPVTNRVASVGGRFFVAVASGQAQALFRLRKP